MRVFLVRHGTSIAHEKGKRQSPDSPLSKKGVSQARTLARRITKWGVSFDKVFTSKLPRASQTADIMAEILGISVEVFEGIHEKEQHPDLYGADVASKIHDESVAAYAKNSRDLDYKFLGQGESIREVVVRAAAFKKHLVKSHPGQDVLVVTHGIFIRAFVASCILGEPFHDASFANLYSSLNFNNTGVSLLECNEKTKNWRIIYLNNFSHLKGI